MQQDQCKNRTVHVQNLTRRHNVCHHPEWSLSNRIGSRRVRSGFVFPECGTRHPAPRRCDQGVRPQSVWKLKRLNEDVSDLEALLSACTVLCLHDGLDDGESESPGSSSRGARVKLTLRETLHKEKGFTSVIRLTTKTPRCNRSRSAKEVV